MRVMKYTCIHEIIRVCSYNPPYIMRFSQLALEAQLGKPSDVRWIMSTHEGSFVFIIYLT